MNYIYLNGEKIELTKEQVKEIEKSFIKNKTKLSDIPVGETFKIGKYEFIILEKSGDTTAVILKDLLFEDKKFGKTNNYENSYVDDLCNDFGMEIADVIGKYNLVEHTVDLTADDGLKDYGKVKRYMSLMTCEQYRKYVYILDKFQVDKWWWLATAYSTPTHGYEKTVKCVSPSGFIYNGNCSNNYFGVRPFCILKSNIFVSK